ncbi:hypothetical protein B296_00016554, partial [Ensete ventricosum]
WFSRSSESKPSVRRSPTNSSVGTSTYWRKSVSTPISEHWPIEELSPKSTTVEYAPDTSRRVTWCSERLRSATRPDPAASWPRTEKTPTGLSMLSKMRHIRCSLQAIPFLTPLPPSLSSRTPCGCVCPCPSSSNVRHLLHALHHPWAPSRVAPLRITGPHHHLHLSHCFLLHH